MSPPDTYDSSHDLEAPQAKAVDPVRSMTEPRTVERTPPLSASISRARYSTSPTSPPFSPLTPVPLSPDSSPTEMACDENEPIIDIDLADSEVSLSKMPAAVDEFEKHTSQARDLSRKEKEVEIASGKDSGIEDLQLNTPGPKIQAATQERDPTEEGMAESKGEATPSRVQIVSHERLPEAQNEGEDLAEPEQEITPTRQQAAWVTEAVAACQANKKNPLNKGTVLIVLGPTDPNKSCLLDANALFRTSDVLGKLCENAQAKSAGCVSQHQLSGLLVLSPASVPELVAEALDVTIESVLPQPSHTTRTTRSAKVKAESDHGDSSPAASDDDLELPKTDWLKAYESFFRIIAGKKHGTSKIDLSTALPQIHRVIDIAQKYNAIDAIQSTFIGLLLGYVENHTLYSTIARWPAHCLNLGIALKSRLVYDEAFKHLVGDGANFKDGKIVPELSDDVQAIVQRRSRELYTARLEVEEKLLLMTLPGKKSADYPSQYVSQHDQHMAYNTVNTFRDWIAWHIGHLRNETNDEPEPFYLCEHTNDCTHVAGFYQTIVGYDYLDAEEVYDDFSSHYKSSSEGRQRTELEAVGQALEQLKDTACKHVEKLSESTLHLADKSGLRYLTCVKVVEAEDVPWGAGSDGDSSDGDEDMDEDSD